jgi:hypothetical protein
MPTLWFRNTWSWGRSGEGYPLQRPTLRLQNDRQIRADHPELETFLLSIDDPQGRSEPLFTENETNITRVFGGENNTPYVKDSFHDYLIRGDRRGLQPAKTGTKACFLQRLEVPGHGSAEIRLRLSSLQEDPKEERFGGSFCRLFETRIEETDRFYASILPKELTTEEQSVSRQAYAGLFWSKQFYYYAVKEWLEGDPSQPSPPPERLRGRNRNWEHLYNRDVISMPDKWEYPWYAAWDLAFHMVALGHADPHFVKSQLLLFLREWYMHPNGQIPAYEFALSDVNPPVHAWACWRVYKLTAPKGKRDFSFLARAFHKLLLNFTWWVNRKDLTGNNLFSGGFLGLDNIGVFDRNATSPFGGRLEQADATAWMAFYCGTMLSMALELSAADPSYADVASKFFEHFVAIAEAINHFDGTGLWDEIDGFYYDQLHVGDNVIPLRVRSLVGIIPLFAVQVLEDSRLARFAGFRKRMDWFLENRPSLAKQISLANGPNGPLRLLAIPSKERFERLLRYVLDENEFLSPYGIRSLSKVHETNPYVLKLGTEELKIQYVPGHSTDSFFGGNSNWRGPVWFPLNYLLIEALERYHYFYGDSFTVEFPTGSGVRMSLKQVAAALAARLSSLFLPDEGGHRPCHGQETRYANDPAWRDLVLFYEYFHGDTGLGLGASHQTGWTALVTRSLETVARARRSEG